MKCVVNGASIEEESANDALDSGKTTGVEWFGVVSRWVELDFGAIGRSGPGVRSMLGTLGTFVKVTFEAFSM